MSTMPQYILNITNKNEACEEMENQYWRLKHATCTSSRRYRSNIMNYLYNKFEAIRKLWEHIPCAANIVNEWAKRTIRKVIPAAFINWNGIEEKEDCQQFYLIRLLDENKELIWSKIGTTTRKTSIRMKEHLRAYAKDGVRYIDIMRVWDCEEYPAEMVESAFRARYIKKYQGTFRKNDRFIGVEFDYDDADKYFQSLLSE